MMTDKIKDQTAESGPIKISREKVAAGQGGVVGALMDLNVREEIPAEVFFLPADKTQNIAAGTALLVADGKSWHKAQFFAQGEIKGPMVYAKTEIDEPGEALGRFRAHVFTGATLASAFGTCMMLLPLLFIAPAAEIPLGGYFFGMLFAVLTGYFIRWTHEEMTISSSRKKSIAKLAEIAGKETVIVAVPKDLED